MRIVRMMFTRRWILTTLLVFAGSALCIRLGIWQLDRLHQRRAFNAHYLQVRADPPLDLNSALTQPLTGFEYRNAVARGNYDFEHQVVLRNQYSDSEIGYHLLTPLMLTRDTAVLVDRGWIPADGNQSPSDWRKYDEPGPVQVSGMLRLGQDKPAFGAVADPPLAPGQTSLQTWNVVNLDRIAQQVPYHLLPVYLQPAPEQGNTTPPIPFQPTIEITEGPHLGYAGQWFTFAALLFFGYPLFYLRKQESQK